MRINLHLAATCKPPRKLMHVWASQLAEEYLVSPQKAYSWMSTEEGRHFVVKHLQDRGWKIDCYMTPAIFGVSVISYGFVVADDCDHLIAWKLSEA